MRKFTIGRDIASRFADIVQLSRERGTYTTIIDNLDGTATIDMTLAAAVGQRLQFDDSPVTYDVIGVGPIVVQGVPPVGTGDVFIFQSFLAGHESEVAAIENNVRRRGPRLYPLVWLLLSNTRNYDPDNRNQEFGADVTLFLVHSSTLPKRDNERIVDVIEPILHPLAERLVNAMVESQAFTHADRTPFFQFEAEALPRFSDKGGNTFNTITDAIRLTFRNLKFRPEKEKCLTL
jgi:hypothetical protein